MRKKRQVFFNDGNKNVPKKKKKINMLCVIYVRVWVRDEFKLHLEYVW